MLVLLTAIVTVLAQASSSVEVSSASVTPHSAASCSFNGRVDLSNGACVCRPQWQGPHCATLRLAPADKEGGFHSPHAFVSHGLSAHDSRSEGTSRTRSLASDPGTSGFVSAVGTSRGSVLAEVTGDVRDDDANTSSWGGSILLDETTGLWHMFAAEMQGDCGIGSWQTNSQVRWNAGVAFCS